VLGRPTVSGANFLRWDGSNGSCLVQFDDDGFVFGCGKDIDQQAGIKRLWRTLCLPVGWLPYFVELSRP
jgi:hypothetical protein